MPSLRPIGRSPLRKSLSLPRHLLNSEDAMSLAALYHLRRIPQDRETVLSRDALLYAAYHDEPPGENDEFLIHTALELEYLRRFLEAYPEESTGELGKIAQGELVPNVQKVVEVLELIDKCLRRHYPDSPWQRYPEVEPTLADDGRGVWLYDDMGSDVVLAGECVTAKEADGFTPFPFLTNGQPTFATHWAKREEGQPAPLPPPTI